LHVVRAEGQPEDLLHYERHAPRREE
jgi:hypothetical protein